jgi:hypothetical protein
MRNSIANNRSGAGLSSGASLFNSKVSQELIAQAKSIKEVGEPFLRMLREQVSSHQFRSG